MFTDIYLRDSVRRISYIFCFRVNRPTLARNDKAQVFCSFLPAPRKLLSATFPCTNLPPFKMGKYLHCSFLKTLIK